MILDQHGHPIAPQQWSPAPSPRGPHTPHSPYKGGGQNRLWRDWQPPHRSGDSAIAESWDLLTSRVRDLFRNEPTLRAAKRALSKHVIGTGIQTFAEVFATPDEADDLFNFESDDEFERWSEEEADAEHRFAWPQMQKLHFEECMESGDSLLLKCLRKDPGRSIPLCYQMLEPEQLDQTMDWPLGGNRDQKNPTKCVRGIEYTRDNVPVAYWIYDAHPYDDWSAWSTKSTRIPAERVIHTYLPNRSSEHRGVTWFSAGVQSAKDLDWYIGNELTAAAIGALLSVVVKREHGSGSGFGFAGDPGASNSDQFGNPLTRLGRGTIADLGKDDELEVVESKRPNRDADPFIKLILMLQSMGVGVSYLRLTGDYSQSSYTSARGAHLDDQAFFAVLQAWAGRSFVRPVRREHTRQAAALGLYRSIGARQFVNNERQYTRIALQPPGREQLDPEMETAAALARIRGGLSTWQDEVGLRGKNWRRVAQQQAREWKTFEKLGIVPDLSYSSQYVAAADRIENETQPQRRKPRNPNRNQPVPDDE